MDPLEEAVAAQECCKENAIDTQEKSISRNKVEEYVKTSENSLESVNETEMPKLTLSEVRSEDDSNMILDENTGEFVNANIKNVTKDFGSKCMLDSDGSTGSGSDDGRRQQQTSKAVGRGGNRKLTGSVTSMETMFRPWLQENPQKLEQPKPAHCGSQGSVRSKKMYEHQDLQPLDMRKSSLGLQVDGANDSRDIKSEGSPSDTSIQSEVDGTESSSVQPKHKDTRKVRDASQLAANDHSYAIAPIENAEQTPSSYSDDYLQSSIGSTPSEASNPPSGMMVSPASPTSTGSTVSTVDTFDDYYNESYDKYQPEGYRNISTSVSQSSSGSEVLLPLESLMQSENDSSGQNTSGSQVPSSTSEMSENAASSHNDLQNEDKETVQSSEGSQSDDTHRGINALAMNKDLENECKDAIAECDRLLQSVEGSHLDMSTLSAFSAGSRNTTTDIMGVSTDITSTGDDTKQEDTVKGSVEETASGGMSTINLDDLVRDNNYEVFTRGVTGSSTPVQSIGDDESTLPYSDEEDRRKKHVRETSSDEELKQKGTKKQRKFKKASKKSDIKSSRN